MFENIEEQNFVPNYYNVYVIMNRVKAKGI